MTSSDGLLVELAVSGRLDGPQLERWLQAAGIGERAAVLAFAVPDPQAGLPPLEGALRRAGWRGATAVCEGLLCAVVDCRQRPSDLLALAGRLREELSAPLGEVRAGVSRPASSAMVAHSFDEARCAVGAARAANGRGAGVIAYEQLGALQLLLSLQPPHALESYCANVLGPIEAQNGSYGEELLRSLDAFIEHNGHWERAAKALYCHRHTLRYRVRRVEQLTERDLSRARDRIELWLALRGRELVR